MGKRLTNEEMLAGIRGLLAISKYNYEEHSWFFPSDLIPFGNSLKYQCRKLYALGLLERHGDGNDRWGYLYRLKGE